MYHGERFNSISHLVGAALALAGLVVLVVFASLQSDVWKIVSFSIYGASLFLLYTLSTLYHSLRGRAKDIFRKLDHIAIYLLIAGSYTPLTLITLRGVWGWTLFGITWALAIVETMANTATNAATRILIFPPLPTRFHQIGSNIPFKQCKPELLQVNPFLK